MVGGFARGVVAICILTACFLPAAASAATSFTITNQGGATAQMMNGVAEAAALWSAKLNDPITINIRVNAAALSPGVLGSTSAFYDPYSYADVRSALINKRLSADDISSSNALQSGPAFSMLINRTANSPSGVVSATPYFDTGLGGPGQAGSQNNTTVRVPVANAKVLGIYPGGSGDLDGTITFTTLQGYDYDRSNGINSGQVDFVGIASHEIGHMLGLLSGVDTLARNGTAPGFNDNQLVFVTPMDLFRFSSRSISAGGGPGVIDWTADTAAKYFSVDGGATPMAAMSTGTPFGDGYEAHHWKNGLGLGLMDPTAASGELLSIGTNDLRALDVIGYNVNVPEPASIGLVLGLGALALAGRPQRRGV